MMIVESSQGFKHPCHIVSRFWFPLKMGHHPTWKDPQQKRQGQPLVVAREKNLVGGDWSHGILMHFNGFYCFFYSVGINHPN